MQQVVSQRVARQEHLVFEGVVRGRLILFDDLPVQQHGLPEGIRVLDYWDYRGDDVHDHTWVRLVVYNAPHQLLQGCGLLLQVATAQMLLQLLRVRRVAIGTDVHCGVPLHSLYYYSTSRGKLIQNTDK